MAPPPPQQEPAKASGLDDDDVELVPDTCVASCVTCGQDPSSTSWPIATSLGCLVGAGCVVLPPDDLEDEAVLIRRRSSKAAAPARPVSREAAPPAAR